MSDDPFATKGGKHIPRDAVHEPRKPIRQAALDPDFEYTVDENADRLHVPRELIPEGMDYQWVTITIFGQPQPQNIARFQRKGWTPVPSERHEGLFMPKGYKGMIEVDGLGLYERPLEFTQLARQHERKKAREQVAIREQQLRGGNIEGVGFDTRHQTVVNKVNKSYERINVPQDDDR